MSCFDVTKGLCNELNMIIARYWWSQQDKNKIKFIGLVGKNLQDQRKKVV